MFGLLDPTGKHDIPADQVTCARYGAHGLAVPTASLIADSSANFAIDRVSAEQLDEQARSLLEDMPISAIKVGGVPSSEIASVIAGIVADYSESPLVLQLPPPDGVSQDDDQELDVDNADPIVGAVLELLVPLAKVVVLPASASRRWLNDDILEQLDHPQGSDALHLLGADWSLTTGFAQRPGSYIHLLQGPEGETISLPCEPTPQRVQDTSGLVACAIACRLAQGLSVSDAARDAITYADRAASQAFQAGMGQRLANRWVSTT